jgi:hypothetical protein
MPYSLLVPFGSALAISSSGENAGAGDNAVSSTSKTSSPSSNSPSTKGSAAVIELPANTGDPTLDKQIDKFYSCVSKTRLDPPSKDQVAGCYFQFVGGDRDSGNSQSSSRDTTSTHSHSHSISKIDNSPLGMLVDTTTSRPVAFLIQKMFVLEIINQ